MHIAFLLPDLNGGGAQKMVINLANWFAHKGYKTDLVLFNATGPYQVFVSEKVRVYDFEKKRTYHAISKLSDYLKTQNPDVMFSALYHVNIIAILAKKAAKTAKTKIVISERNHPTKRLNAEPFLKQKFWTGLISSLYPLSDKIIAISNGVAEDLNKIIGTKDSNKIETVYNPVVTDDFENKLYEAATSIFPDGCTTKIITSGRLVEQKDYPTLLKSFSLYLKHDPNAHLAILGDGHLSQEIQFLTATLDLENNITFAGFISNPLPLMASADLFVITSAWEGFCNVIVEALYCGLRIVSTDCPSGPAEILGKGNYGYLAPVGNAEEIANLMIEAMAAEIDPEHQKARAMAFHVDKIGTEFETKFRALIS